MTGALKTGLMPGLAEWLEGQGIEYEVHEHERSLTATATARAEGVDPKTFAKVVWVRTQEGEDAFMVIDALDHLDLKKAAGVLRTSRLELVSEEEIATAAPDCELGAMPAVGRLFLLPTFADHAVAEDAEISFNGGSHSTAVRVDRAQWERGADVTYRDLVAHPWKEPAWARS